MFTRGRIFKSLPKSAHVEWDWPISQEKNLKIHWSVKMMLHWLIKELKEITTAGSVTAAGSKFPQSRNTAHARRLHPARSVRSDSSLL